MAHPFYASLAMLVMVTELPASGATFNQTSKSGRMSTGLDGLEGVVQALGPLSHTW